MQDALQLLSDAQALTGTSAILSTNTIDLKVADNGFDMGEPMCLEVTVDVAAGGTYTNILIEAITSAAENLGSATSLISRTVLGAALVAGRRIIVPLPPEAIAQRYLGARYTQTGTSPTLTVTCSVKPLKFVQLDKNYPDAITIN